MLTALVEDPGRNQLIAGDVLNISGQRDETCLVVSDRVAHCETLAGILETQGLRVEVLTGQISRAERERIVADVQAGKVDVLCSTVQLLGEGFDCKGLSSLFLATPIKFKGRLLQVIGRILRPADGKQPKVYDYQDKKVGVLCAQAKTRGKALKEIAA
jgi:superfamily II DNA or RNA helicase